MDEHFRSTPLDRNLPVILAVLGVWYNNFFGGKARRSYLTTSISRASQLLPARGYGVQRQRRRSRRQLRRLPNRSRPLGEPGTNGQHAFYQLIRQGTKLIPCDFIALVKSTSLGEHHPILLSNFFA